MRQPGDENLGGGDDFGPDLHVWDEARARRELGIDDSRGDFASLGYGMRVDGPGHQPRYDLSTDHHDTLLRKQYRGIGPKGWQRSDARIVEDINEALSWHAEVDAREIQVSMQNGVVTLEGQVPSKEHWRLVGRIAGGTLGIRDVLNQIHWR